MSDARFDIEAALGTWRRRYEVDDAFSADDLEELECHVCDHVAALVRQGRDEEAAFHEGVRKVGTTTRRRGPTGTSSGPRPPRAGRSFTNSGGGWPC